MNRRELIIEASKLTEDEIMLIMYGLNTKQALKVFEKYNFPITNRGLWLVGKECGKKILGNWYYSKSKLIDYIQRYTDIIPENYISLKEAKKYGLNKDKFYTIKHKIKWVKVSRKGLIYINEDSLKGVLNVK
jgi:hypothetical protein